LSFDNDINTGWHAGNTPGPSNHAGLILSGGGGGSCNSSDFLWYLDNDIKVYAKDLNASGYNTKSPFFLGQCSLSSADGGVQFLDMYPEDGWMLVGKSFGESSTGTCTPPLPFFALYNKYRGIMRVMIYRPNNAIIPFSTGYLVSLSLQGDAAQAPIFTFNQNTKCYLDNFQRDVVLTTATQGSFIENWVWADFNLTGFDPILETKPNLRLAVQLTAQDFTQVNLSGTLKLDGYIGNNIQPSGNETLNGVNSAVANGVKFIKGANGIVKELTEFMKPFKDSLGNYTSYTAIGDIVKGLKPASDFFSAISPFGSILNYVLQLVGGNAPAAPTPISLKGSINLTGSQLTSRPGALGIIGLNTNYPATGAEIKPVQSIPWGIINFRTPIENGDYFVPGGNGAPSTYNMRTDLQYIVNPNCGMTLQTIEARYIGTQWGGISPSYHQVYPSNDFKNNYDYIIGTTRAPSIGIRIVFNINVPTKTIGNQVVIMFRMDGGLSGGRQSSEINEEIVSNIPYPNPSSTSIKIPINSNQTGEAYSVKVYSTFGQKVWEFSGASMSQSDEVMWDISNSNTSILSGMYLCEVLVGEKVTTHKLIVQK
jgi:Secretion system C-terminal sorting domain